MPMSGGPHPSARLPETGRQRSAHCPRRGSEGAAPRVRTGMRAERRCNDELCVCARARCRRRRLAQWDARLVQLARFRRRFGHSAVPHDWKENPDLHRCRPVSVCCAAAQFSYAHARCRLREPRRACRGAVADPCVFSVGVRLCSCFLWYERAQCGWRCVFALFPACTSAPSA